MDEAGDRLDAPVQVHALFADVETLVGLTALRGELDPQRVDLVPAAMCMC